MFAGEDLDESIGIGNGSRFIADHHDHVMRRLAEGQHAIVQARRRVDDQNLHAMVEIAEGADDAGLFRFGKVGHALDAGSRRNDLQPMWARDDCVLQRTLALDDVAQVESSVQPQNHVDVGQTEIRIDQHHVAALRGDRHGEVGRYGRFADTAFAAGDCDDLDRTRGIELHKCFRLIS